MQPFKPLKVQHYMLSFMQKNMPNRVLDDTRMVPEGLTYRPSRVMTTVTEPGQVIIDGMYIGGQNQIMGTVDAFQWSTKYFDAVMQAFLKEHGLLGKSDEEIDAYMDAHEYSMPDPCRVDLPTVQGGAKIRVTGRFDKVPDDFNFVLTMQGPAAGDVA